MHSETKFLIPLCTKQPKDYLPKGNYLKILSFYNTRGRPKLVEWKAPNGVVGSCTPANLAVVIKFIALTEGEGYELITDDWYTADKVNRFLTMSMVQSRVKNEQH